MLFIFSKACCFPRATLKKIGIIIVAMVRTLLPPYLTTSGGVKCCSACHQQFDARAMPSLGAAFRKHVEDVHRGKREDTNQAGEGQSWWSEKSSE
jgi:hypothetical protein